MNPLPPIEPESAVLPIPADAAKLARLRKQARLFQLVYRLNKALTFAGLPYLAFLLITWCLYGYPSWPQWYTKVIIVVGFANALLGIWSMQWKAAMNGLLRAADAQNIGLFVEGYDVKHERLFVMETLTRLLPRLKSSDAHLLNAHHHLLLNHLLKHKIIMENPAERAFACAILKAYEQVGGAEDLPTVERLANGGGYAKRNKDVREAAQACLPYLQARSEGQELRQNLLRASDAADNPATLLRPASAATETDPALLLRASQSDAPQ